MGKTSNADCETEFLLTDVAGGLAGRVVGGAVVPEPSGGAEEDAVLVVVVAVVLGTTVVDPSDDFAALDRWVGLWSAN